jgi:mannose-1-phosphate guanylyltransferase/phosphomannomutase
MKIHCSVGGLGTAGRSEGRHLLGEPFVVISRRRAHRPTSEIIASHQSRRPKATLTLYRVPNPLEYGVVIIDDEGRIRQFLEKPSWGEVFSDTVNTGIYVLEPSIFDYIQKDKVVDFSQDVFPSRLRGDGHGHAAEGYWTDVGNIRSMMRANADMFGGGEPEPSASRWAAASGRRTTAPRFYAMPRSMAPPASQDVRSRRRHPPRADRGSGARSSTPAYRSTADHLRNTYIGERAEVRRDRRPPVQRRPKAMVFDGAVVGDNTTVGEARHQPGIRSGPTEAEDGATRDAFICDPGEAHALRRFGVTARSTST